MEGTIGGMEYSYLCLGYRMAFILTGANIHSNFHLMGDDPKCFLGWSHGPKEAFLYPGLVISLFTITLASIVLVNLDVIYARTMRSKLEVFSIGGRLVAIGVIEHVRWILGTLAFMRFPYKDIADCTKAYQVLNAWFGVITYYLVGTMTKKLCLSLHAVLGYEVNVKSYVTIL